MPGLLLAALSLSAWGRQAPACSQAPSQTAASPRGKAPDSQPAASRQEQDRKVLRQEESQRGFGVVPMFGVTSRQDAQPLTRSQKFHLFVKSAFDPFAFGEAAIQSGISQAQDSFPDYGQGAAGYGRRFGAAFGDSVSSNFFSNFFYPVLLRQDPRYFRSRRGSIKRRIGYALAQELVAHNDKGKRMVSFSNILGAVSAGAVSNAYYPQRDRGFTLTMTRAGIALIYGSIGGLLNEFWPDIDRKVFHKRPRAAMAR
ncbi:MAG TPA: hypothetical protein VFU27_10925 [Terriglobales bacterium]|nr:hypothetical protein [Terriglobales bacterium]